jgi:hypothetical protein
MTRMKTYRSSVTLFLLLTCSLASCNIGDAPPGTNPKAAISAKVGEIIVCDSKRIDDPSIRILFVGNSLTYTNNLPALVVSIGNAQGKSVYSETLAYPNYAIEDHWNDGKLQKLICEGDFDFVVIQQGPSSQADGRAMLFDYGQRIKNICLSRGSELAFFMVWPAKANWHMFDGVIKNYTEAATETSSILCAVGAEFKRHGDSGDYSFYSSDKFHPSPTGSQRAAEIIFSTLVN